MFFSNSEFGSRTKTEQKPQNLFVPDMVLSFIPVCLLYWCVLCKVTPSSAINLSQFVIQWCTNFPFGDTSDCFYFILFCILSGMELSKLLVWTAHSERHTLSILYFWIRTILQNPNGIYGANIILSLLYIIILYQSAVKANKTKSHKSTRCIEKTFWNRHILVPKFRWNFSYSIANSTSARAVFR